MTTPETDPVLQRATEIAAELIHGARAAGETWAEIEASEDELVEAVASELGFYAEVQDEQ